MKDFDPSTVTLAAEVDIALLNFQNSPPGIMASVPVAANPQTINASDDEYVKRVLRATENAGITVLSIAFDGVSSKSFVCAEQTMAFFYGDSTCVGLLDLKHLAKALRNAVLGPNILAIGSGIVDRGAFLDAKLPASVVRPTNFAADKPVEILFSADSIMKTIQAMEYETDSDTFVTSMTMFFSRSLLLASDCDTISNRDKILLLLLSLQWFTSMSGLPAVTKRNLMKGLLGSVLLLLQKDVKKLRLFMTESNEHFNGILRQMMPTFNCTDFVGLSERGRLVLDKLVNFNLKDRRGDKGYHGSRRKFIETTWISDPAEGLKGGPVQCDYSASNVYSQIAPELLKCYNYSVDIMTKLLSNFQVSKSHWSPFCKAIEKKEDFVSLYYYYMDDNFRSRSAYTPDPLPYDATCYDSLYDIGGITVETEAEEEHQLPAMVEIGDDDSRHRCAIAHEFAEVNVLKYVSASP